MFPETPSIEVGKTVIVYLLTPITKEDETKIVCINAHFLSMGAEGVTLGRDMLHPEFFIPLANVAYIKVVG